MTGHHGSHCGQPFCRQRHYPKLDEFYEKFSCFQVVVRRLPPSLTSEQFLEVISPVPELDYFKFHKSDPTYVYEGLTRKIRMDQNWFHCAECCRLFVKPTENSSYWPLRNYSAVLYLFSSLGSNGTSRAYLNFVNRENLIDFTETFDGYVFVDNRGKKNENKVT